MRVSRLLAVLVATSTLVSVVGCGASPVQNYKGSKASADDEDDEDDDLGEEDDDTRPQRRPTPEPEPEPTEPDQSGPVTQDQIPPAGQCSTPTNKKLCVGCCVGGSAQAANAFATCACDSPGVCAAECGDTFCAGKQPSAACSSCMDQRAMQCAEATTGGSTFNLPTLQCLVTCF